MAWLHDHPEDLPKVLKGIEEAKRGDLHVTAGKHYQLWVAVEFDASSDEEALNVAYVAEGKIRTQMPAGAEATLDTLECIQPNEPERIVKNYWD